MKKIALCATVLAVSALSGCGTVWKNTAPTQTSLDQIMVSTAADRAAASLTSHYQKQINADLPRSLGKSFIVAKNFVTSSELYALQAIRNSFLKEGVILVDDATKADTIIEVANGALSIDNTSQLVGIPAMALPIPLAGNVQIPEVSLYKTVTNRGLSKLSAGFYDAHTGKSKGAPITTIGTATVDNWEAFVFLKFIDNDLQLPEEYEKSYFLK